MTTGSSKSPPAATEAPEKFQGLAQALGLGVDAVGTESPVVVIEKLPPAWAAVPAGDHPWRRYLPHIERMAAQQMTTDHIAARLGISPAVLQEAREMYADVDAAFTGGVARGVDEVSEMMHTKARLGDVNAGKFHLQTAGYNARQQSQLTVTMPAGAAGTAQMVSVHMGAIDDMATRQRRLGAPAAPAAPVVIDQVPGD